MLQESIAIEIEIERGGLVEVRAASRCMESKRQGRKKKREKREECVEKRGR